MTAELSPLSKCLKEVKQVVQIHTESANMENSYGQFDSGRRSATARTHRQNRSTPGYDTLFGNNQTHWPQRLTNMTVSEVIAAGPTWTKNFGSSAAGRYQFLNATLKRLRSTEALDGSENFGPDLQDRLGYALLDRRGYEKFATGKLSVVAFGLELAKEWASFPVLQPTQGTKRMVTRGQSYYAGDGLNHALITPETVEAILQAHPSDLALTVLAAMAQTSQEPD